MVPPEIDEVAMADVDELMDEAPDDTPPADDAEDAVSGPEMADGAAAGTEEKDKKDLEPDPPFPEQYGMIRWVVTKFSQISSKKVFSPIFSSGPHNWNIMMFPRGNNHENVAFYLQVQYSEKYPRNSVKLANFALSVINQTYPEKTSYRELTHEFKRNDNDWGLTQNDWKFSVLDDPAAGFVVDDTIVFEIHVQLLPSEYSSSPWSGRAYWDYDSKKETGYVGIKNQGATCYMNSLLQALFFTAPLRSAVYQLPPPEDEEEGGDAADAAPDAAAVDAANDGRESISLALARLFYRLQFTSDSGSTKALTKSFGWDMYETFTQHDVQELSRVLVDNLEQKMKETPVSGTMNRLFEGKVENFIRCLDVDYASTRSESYYDISLNVLGCAGVMKSFEKFTEGEVLDGDNKYQAEGFGLQRAEKGCSFLTFPPVLHLHLKRFEYDMVRNTNYKVNDRYEFPRRLCLDRYLSEKADRGVPNEYELHGVLVHSGDVQGGHYYAYLRPTLAEEWFKFDDDRVSRAKEEDAIENNFGGEEGFNYALAGKEHKNVTTRITSAYMLVYFRVAEREQMLTPPQPSEVPEHLRDRFEEELKVESEAKAKTEEAYRYMNVKVVTNKELTAHHEQNLCDVKSIEVISILRDESLWQFKEQLAILYGVPPHRMRVWRFINRSNKTSRPDQPFQNSEETAMDVLVKHNGRVYVEFADPPPGGDLEVLTPPKPERTPADPVPSPVQQQGEQPPSGYEKDFPVLGETPPERELAENPRPGEEEGRRTFPRVPSAFPHHGPQDVLLFVKWFDETGPELSFLGTLLLEERNTVVDVMAGVRALRSLDEDAEICMFEEITPTWIEPMVEFDKTLKEAELRNGDLLIAQRGRHLTVEERAAAAAQATAITADATVSDAVMDEVDAKPAVAGDEVAVVLPKPVYHDVVAYYNHLVSRRIVEFRELAKPKDKGFSLELSINYTYDQVAAAVGKHLGAAPEMVRFTGQSYTKNPKVEPYRASLAPGLDTMLTVSYYDPKSKVLYYEVLEESIYAIEGRKTIAVPWYSSKVEEVKTYAVTVSSKGTVVDVLAALKEVVPIEGSGVLRLYENWPAYFRPYNETDSVAHVSEYYLRAEEVDQELLDATEEDMIITCKHFEADVYSLRPFGSSFYFVLHKGELFSSVRERIQKKLGVADEEFEKWKFAKCRYSTHEDYLKDDDVVGDMTFGDHDSLGMVHADTTPRHTSRVTYSRPERAIKIYH